MMEWLWFGLGVGGLLVALIFLGRAVVPEVTVQVEHHSIDSQGGDTRVAVTWKHRAASEEQARQVGVRLGQLDAALHEGIEITQVQ